MPDQTTPNISILKSQQSPGEEYRSGHVIQGFRLSHIHTSATCQEARSTAMRNNNTAVQTSRASTLRRFIEFRVRGAWIAFPQLA